MEDHEEILRKLTIRDDAYVESLLVNGCRNLSASGLDPKTHALVRIGALIGIDASAPSYLATVELGLLQGATIDEIVGTLIAVLPAIGSSRVVSAAPKLGLAIGYDVGQALEELDLTRVSRARGLGHGL